MTELKKTGKLLLFSLLFFFFVVGLLCTAFLTLRGGCAVADAAAFCCLLLPLLPLAVGKKPKLSDRNSIRSSSSFSVCCVFCFLLCYRCFCFLRIAFVLTSLIYAKKFLWLVTCC